MQEKQLDLTASRPNTPSVAAGQAVASRSKPKEEAKVAGNPGSVTVRRGASAGRALRAKRCAQERRQCARSARVNVFSAGASDDEHGEELSRQVVWLRIPLSQVRQMPQRGQSRQRTGAEANGALAVSGGGDESEREAPSGNSTALTRRGLNVVLLS